MCNLQTNIMQKAQCFFLMFSFFFSSASVDSVVQHKPKALQCIFTSNVQRPQYVHLTAHVKMCVPPPLTAAHPPLHLFPELTQNLSSLFPLSSP